MNERTSGTTTITDPPAERTVVEPAPHERTRAIRARQRERYGGVSWGAAFFGWLVAIGLGALLVGLLAAAGAAIGLTDLSTDEVTGAEEISLAGGLILLAALALAYGCGGYAAGRMARFDGARQGAATWLIGVIVTLALAGAGALIGSEYNVLERLDLPAMPVGDTELVSGGAIALAIVAIGSLLAAIAGGKAGERFHHRVDRFGFVD
jgi:hypothetical protein